MTELILRNGAIQAEMEKPWAEKAVSWYLTAMLRWLDYGYVFTDEQKEMVEKLSKESK